MGAGPPSREWARTVAMGPSQPGLQYSKTTSARSLRWSLLRPEDLGRLSHGCVLSVLACTVVDNHRHQEDHRHRTSNPSLCPPRRQPCTMTTTSAFSNPEHHGQVEDHPNDRENASVTLFPVTYSQLVILILITLIILIIIIIIIAMNNNNFSSRRAFDKTTTEASL